MTLATFSTSHDMYTKDKKSAIHCRITNYEYEQLNKIALEYNISVSILCRNIITAYLSKGNKKDANQTTFKHD